VLDGQPDRGHDPSPDLALGGAGGHGEKSGKINVSSETKTNIFGLEFHSGCQRM
jgi:hypothetical protein